MAAATSADFERIIATTPTTKMTTTTKMMARMTTTIVKTKTTTIMMTTMMLLNLSLEPLQSKVDLKCAACAPYHAHCGAADDAPPPPVRLADIVK
jgi:hypothetical protein